MFKRNKKVEPEPEVIADVPEVKAAPAPKVVAPKPVVRLAGSWVKYAVDDARWIPAFVTTVRDGNRCDLQIVDRCVGPETFVIEAVPEGNSVGHWKAA